MEETERRIYAACQRFQITPEDVGDRLYVDSGREQPCVIAEDLGQGARIIRPIADAVIEQIKERGRSEEHTSELQSLMRISYAVFCLKKKKHTYTQTTDIQQLQANN